MNNKIILWLFVSLLLVSSASAWDWDNTANYNAETKTYEIINALGIGDKIAEYKLTENKPKCIGGTECEAYGTANLLIDNYLFSNAEFRDDNGKNLNKKYNIQIKEIKTIVSKVPEYKEICNEKTEINNSISRACTNEIVNYKEEIRTVIVWNDYKGEVLKEGVYEWRLQGKKTAEERIDWILEAQGIIFNEWDWWEDNHYTKAINITITNNKAEDQTEYPIYISLNTSSLGECPAVNESMIAVREGETTRAFYIANGTMGSSSENVTLRTRMNISASSTETNLQIACGCPNCADANYSKRQVENIFEDFTYTSTSCYVTGDEKSISDMETYDGGTGICNWSSGFMIMDGSYKSSGFKLNNNFKGIEDGEMVFDYSYLTTGGFNTISWTSGGWFRINLTSNSSTGIDTYNYVDGTNEYDIRNNSGLHVVGAGAVAWNGVPPDATGAKWYKLIITFEDNIVNITTNISTATASTQGFYANYNKNINGKIGILATEDGAGGDDYIRIDNIRVYKKVKDMGEPTFFSVESEAPIVYPIVQSLFPINESTSYSISVNFTYNATGLVNTIDNCSLWLRHSFAGADERNSTDTSITNEINQTFNLTLGYENVYWKVGCYNNASLQTNSSEYNYTRLISYPSINLQEPVNLYQSATKYVNFTYNVTQSYGAISSCSLWFNEFELNSTDISITQVINQTFNVTLNNSHNWNWKVECIDEYGRSQNSSIYNLSRNVLPATPIQISPVNNTVIVNNYQVITCDGSTDVDGDEIKYEFWNGTETADLKIGQNSTNKTFLMNMDFPQQYYFKCRVNDNMNNSDYTGAKTITYAQLYQNCTGSNFTSIIAYNFTFADELNNTKLHNFTMSNLVVYFGNNTVINKTLGLSGWFNDEFKYCLSPKNVSLYANIFIEYSKTDYVTRTYNIKNTLVTPAVQNITLYTVLSTTTDAITITVTDAQDIPLGNLIVEAWLFDFGTGAYSLVDTETTNNNGIVIMNLILNKYYMFKIYEGSVLKDSTDKEKLYSTALTIKITTPAEPLKPTMDLTYLSYNFSWVNETKNITFSYSNADLIEGITDLCWKVDNLTAQNISNMYSYCWNTLNGNYSGQDDYIISTTFGYYRAYAYAMIKGIKYNIDSFEIDLRGKPVFGEEGLVIGLLVVLALGGLGLASKNPAVTIVMVLFGIAINYLTFLWMIPWYAMISIVIVGVILLILSRT